MKTYASIEEILSEAYSELYQEILEVMKAKVTKKGFNLFRAALLIQKMPDNFPVWKDEADKHFGIKRNKIIQGYIRVIKKILFEHEYHTEIEQHAVESVRPELTEQLEYWQNELKKTPPQPIAKKKAPRPNHSNKKNHENTIKKLNHQG